MKVYQSYLFDLDGTLLDTMQDIIASYEHTFSYLLNKYQVTAKVAKGDLRGLMGIPLRETLQIYYSDYPGIIDEAEVVYRDYQFNNWKKNVKPFDGCVETLKTLKALKRKTAIVTSRILRTTKMYSDHFGLDQWIDIYITPDIVANPKPHPESAFKAASMLESDTADCLFVGDSIFDIQCAQAAGMDSALVTWGSTNETEYNKINSTYILQKFADLLPGQ